MAIIALDCDGVICNIEDEFAIRIEKDFGFKTHPEQWQTHRIAQQFPQIPESWVDDQLADPAFWLNGKPYEESWFYINKWFMENNDIFIITCRGVKNSPVIETITERWFDEWEINYNRIYFDQTRFGKHETCLRIGADFLVEDDPHEVKVAADFLPAYLIHHGYNSDYTDIGLGIRIKSLADLDDIVSGEVKNEIRVGR